MKIGISKATVLRGLADGTLVDRQGETISGEDLTRAMEKRGVNITINKTEKDANMNNDFVTGMRQAHARLGKIIQDHMGEDGTLNHLPAVHPIHAIVQVHKEISDMLSDPGFEAEAEGDPRGRQYNGTDQAAGHGGEYARDDADRFEDDRSSDARNDGQPRSPAYRKRAWAVVTKRAKAYQDEHPEKTIQQAINHVMKHDSIAKDAVGIYQDMPADSDELPQLRPEPARESVAKAKAWKKITDAAERLQQKSSVPLSRAAAINKVMRDNLSLVREYQNAV